VPARVTGHNTLDSSLSVVRRRAGTRFVHGTFLTVSALRALVITA